MTLKQLLIQTYWQQVSAVLSGLFPDHVQQLQYYEMAFDELRAMAPNEGNIRLVIGQFHQQSPVLFYVLGFEGDCRKGFSLKFSPWETWLGASIDDALLSQYEPSKIIAICLYDMTWASFRSEGINEFRREFIKHEEMVLALYGLVEEIEASEPHPVKQKQRSNEIFEAIGLYDFDFELVISTENESPAYHQARLAMESDIYCLGESETDYERYCSKIAGLRKDFLLKWPKPENLSPLVH